MAKLLTCLILSCIFLLPLHSQVEVSAHFVHIGLNQGLSQATVFDITQDKRGNMWFATQNGLNKYDGYGFTVYQHDEQNRHSIANDVVRTCITDKSGQIWIGTEEGLSLYNADKNWFENFAYPNNSKKQFINGIVELDEKQLLLYINRQKLLIFNIETRSFSDIMPIGDLQEIVPTAISRQETTSTSAVSRSLRLFCLSKDSKTGYGRQTERQKHTCYPATVIYRPLDCN